MDVMAYTPDPARGADVYAADRAHVFHSWSAQKALKPLAIAHSDGCYVWDFEGNRYLDFSSRLATIAPQHANEARGQAATRLVELAPDGMNKVFFTNGGADANENAIRMARLHTGRDKVLTFYRSYHGNTEAAITSTGDPRRWPNEYATGHVHFFGPYLYRSSFWATSQEQECERALEHLEQVIQFEGPGTIAAILIESIVGTAGVLVPPPGYLAGVRALCDKYRILWIADEVMSGFGRAGSWFAFGPHGAVPDLITFAKGSNSGYVPVGGVIISDPVAATFDERAFPGGLTYSGHPLAAASIVATIDAMKEEGIVENAARIGAQVLGPGLAELAERHPVIGEVRGLGVFWALDLVSDRSTRAMLAPYGGGSEAMATLAAQARAKGLLTFINYNRLHVVPPCIITDAEAKEGLAILDEILTAVDAYYKG